MKLAINTTVRGKPTERKQHAEMTTSYENVDVTADELGKLVRAGYAFCPQHKNNRRTTKNFICSDFLAVDIDHGMTIEEALSHLFVKTFGALIYTTESHTEDDHRFRIVFELEQTITTASEMKVALTGLIRKFGGDESCKDACRQFYGSRNCRVLELKQVLPAEQVQKLVTLAEDSKPIHDSSEVKSGSNRGASQVSRLIVDIDQQVRLADGNWMRLGDLDVRSSIHCPVHTDRQPSAFVVRSKQGTLGVHCKSCNLTFFTSSGAPLYDFNYGLSNLDRFVKQDPQLIIGSPAPIAPDAGIVRISERFLPEIQSDTPYTMVKSPKGTGKTQWLEAVVKQCKKKRKTVLLIGHRRSLIRSVAARLGLRSYITTEHTVKNGKPVTKQATTNPTKYYAVCADSLPILLNPIRNKYDVVIVDEVEQVFSHLTAGTLRDRRNDVYQFFRHYLNAAERVYLLDADLSQLTVETVALMAKDSEKEMTLVLNDYKPEKRRLEIYQDKAHLTADLIAALARGERCFVCSNSKRWVSILERSIESELGSGVRCLTITSDNSDKPEIQDFIVDIKNKILDYDVVIVSPSLGTGVDISFANGASHIDTVYGFFEARVNTHFDIDQQLSRVRNPGRIKVWITWESFRFSIDPAVIKAEAIESDRSTRHIIDIQADGTIIYHNDGYLDLYSNVLAMQRGSKNNLRHHFQKLREHEGWEVSEVAADPELISRGQEITKEGTEIYEDDRLTSTLQAKIITGKEFGWLVESKDRQSLTREQEFAMTRYQIERFFLADISKELIERYANGKLRKRLALFELYTSDETELLRRDSVEIKDALHTTDQHHHILTKRLIFELLKSAGLADLENLFLIDKEVTSDDLGDFVKLCKKRKERLSQRLEMDLRKDLDKKPAQQLSSLLRAMGIHWSKSQVKQNGNKIYRYRIEQKAIDTLEDLLALSADLDRIRQWEATRESITENRLFDEQATRVYRVANEFRDGW